MTTSQRKWSWGAELTPDGAANFRVWAPGHRSVAVESAASGHRIAMHAADGGWFELETDAVAPGGAYSYVLDNGPSVPDPAARAQVGDVHGASLLLDPDAYHWRETAWRGRPWSEAVVYELHTGTFSPEGTFAGIETRLGHLVDLGVTAVELMPVAQFSGTRGWGYDGVKLYAPHNAYGRPDDLKHLVDTAHARGLMVLLDVVYNHFGPDGNYLHALAPAFFDETRHTPWGAAIDYTQPAVRAFAIENALYWLEEFRFDGLRLDAIDQILDPSPKHVLVELAEHVRARLPGREVHLTTEDASNETKLHERDATGRPRLYTAEWNDDLHHTAHVAATGEAEGYYQDYTRPAELMARILGNGFAYQGEPSPTWDGAPRGEPSAHLPPTAFIDFIQNHDQVGNRALGERLTKLAAPAAVEALTAALLLSPHVPLLFMGEEWAETAPFLFFTDFHDDLADAVREGRRREFAKWRAFTDPAARERIPDPNAWATFEASRIDWARRDLVTGAERLAFVRHLIALRAREIVPRLAGIGGHAALRTGSTASLAHAAWRLADGAILSLTINLSAHEAAIPTAIIEAGDGVPAFDPAAALFAHPAGAAADLARGRLRAWALAVGLTHGNGGAGADTP